MALTREKPVRGNAKQSFSHLLFLQCESIFGSLYYRQSETLER